MDDGLDAATRPLTQPLFSVMLPIAYLTDPHLTDIGVVDSTLVDDLVLTQ